MYRSSDKIYLIFDQIVLLNRDRNRTWIYVWEYSCLEKIIIKRVSWDFLIISLILFLKKALFLVFFFNLNLLLYLNFMIIFLFFLYLLFFIITIRRFFFLFLLNIIYLNHLFFLITIVILFLLNLWRIIFGLYCMFNPFLYFF
jgi:hypothetical protein